MISEVIPGITSDVPCTYALLPLQDVLYYYMTPNASLSGSPSAIYKVVNYMFPELLVAGDICIIVAVLPVCQPEKHMLVMIQPTRHIVRLTDHFILLCFLKYLSFSVHITGKLLHCFARF